MKTVWRYNLDLSQGMTHELTIPDGARMVSARETPVFSPESLVIETWWELDTGGADVVRTVHVIMTGDVIPENTFYRRTVVFEAVQLAFHIYENLP